MCSTQTQAYFETEVKTGNESVLFWKLVIVISLIAVEQNATELRVINYRWFIKRNVAY